MKNPNNISLVWTFEDWEQMEKESRTHLKKISDLAHKLDIELRIGLQCVWGMRTDKININNQEKIETNSVEQLELYVTCSKICNTLKVTV